jgi:hypothetical protein
MTNSAGGGLDGPASCLRVSSQVVEDSKDLTLLGECRMKLLRDFFYLVGNGQAEWQQRFKRDPGGWEGVGIFE